MGKTDRSLLVVDDDDTVRHLIRKVLECSGYSVVEAASGSEAVRVFYDDRPALVVLDISMPEFDGYKLLERVREVSDVPVLMLTAHQRELDKVRALQSGADDYLTKPFGNQELVARIEALLRRAGESHRYEEHYSDELLTIDFAQRRVRLGETEVQLTPLEFTLLTVFARHANQVLSRDQLLELVWGDPDAVTRDEVKVYVGYLRKKLKLAGGANLIETMRGFGYRYPPATTETET